MTDTPDALIAQLLEAYEESKDLEAAKGALRARLTAGDAAIKRVAELGEAIELLRQDHAAMNARLVAALNDLAAARADGELFSKQARAWEDRATKAESKFYLAAVAQVTAEGNLAAARAGCENGQR